MEEEMNTILNGTALSAKEAVINEETNNINDSLLYLEAVGVDVTDIRISVSNIRFSYLP
jgi:hypothetical protein